MGSVRNLLSTSEAWYGIELNDASNLAVTDIGLLTGRIPDDASELFRRHAREGHGSLDEYQEGCGSEELELHVEWSM